MRGRTDQNEIEKESAVPIPPPIHTHTCMCIHPPTHTHTHTTHLEVSGGAALQHRHFRTPENRLQLIQRHGPDAGLRGGGERGGRRLLYVFVCVLLFFWGEWWVWEGWGRGECG